MAGNKLNFTRSAIDALPLPAPGKRKFYYDTRVRSLAILVFSNGSRKFYVYRWFAGKPVKHLLGPYPDLSVENARDMAEKINAQMVGGEDPSEARRARISEWTFATMFDWYINEHAKPRNKATWPRDCDRKRLHLSSFDNLKLSQITRPLVRQRIAEISIGKSGKYEANRVLALISVVFNTAIKYEIFDGPNPATGVEKYKEQSRDRRLQGGEIAGFLKALDEEQNPDLKDFVRLSLLTGQRRGNVLAMRWAEIDAEERTWRIPRTKTGRPQVVPLGKIEWEILDSRRAAPDVDPEWVFPANSATGHVTSPHKAWDKFRKRAGVPDLRLHDLRRTMGSLMVDAGASLPLIGNALGHLHPSTTAIYARMSLDPIREAKRKAFERLFDEAYENE